MNRKYKLLSNFDPVQGYKILNTIIPSKFQSKFPYSELTPEKIQFAQEKIEIIAKSVDSFNKTKTTNLANPVHKTGSSEQNDIIIYG